MYNFTCLKSFVKKVIVFRCEFCTQKTYNRIKTRRLRQLNFNKTGISNLYKFMTVLKSEIYTKELKELLCGTEF